MTDFIKYEVWEGYWCFESRQQLDIHSLSKLDFVSFGDRKEIQIRIETNKDSIKPTEHQIKSIGFIQNKQDEIIDSIFKYYQNVILPVFQNATDVEEEEIALSKVELDKVLGTLAIEIPEYKISDSINFLIEFDFRYDPEHGLYILFENTKPIDFFGAGDKNYDATHLYEREGYSDNQIQVNLYQLSGESIFKKNLKFDELVKFNLQKGTYRMFFTANGIQRCQNFYVPNALSQFTIRKLLTNQ